ncbi:MAG: hypothetical protein H7A23_15450 [Leptospiraceae bacterium]|nr:hypothetical protein [Leptospiraceae bacterium]MCP5495946.1 hypothetical protein [Leptospiraceae bacterium]
MNQITVSLHEVGSDSHIDIFFDVLPEEKLITYMARTEDWIFFKKGKIITCAKKEDHRRIYLSYEGDISDNRGKLKVLWQGKYSNPSQSFKKIIKLKFENETVLIL